MKKVRMTRQQLEAFIRSDWRNGIIYAVDNNPRAAYMFIKNRLTHITFPNWSNGFEAAEVNREKMQKTLINSAVASGNPSQFTQGFMLNIPYRVDANNWTIQL